VTAQDLYRQSRRAAALGAAVSLALGGAKLAGGVWGHSIALLSDSIHSLGDAGVAAVVLAALHGSELPPDPEHPYGHTRLEAIAGSNVALLLALSALWIIWESVTTFGEPSPEPAMFALWIAAASMVLNEALYHYKRRVAGRTGSSTIRATAWDHRLDAYSSLTVFVALALVKLGGPAFHAADHVAAVLVALVILWVAGTLFWNSLQELMDRQADPELVDAVRHEAVAVGGVQDVEKLLVRKTGLEYLVDIHVEVNPALSVREGHDIAHNVKDRIMERVVPIKDVLVHIEPAPEKATSSFDSDLRRGTRTALHADMTLTQEKLARYGLLSTDELVDSLKPGRPNSLKVRPDGLMMDGHHRIKILRDRGVDVDSLDREIVQ
jgi:cation diffusion facilitator family transporter